MYSFYIGDVLLPVAPDKLTLKIKNANKTMTLINDGEVNFLRDAGLTDIEFDAMIPAVQYPFAVYESGFQPASYYTKHLEKLKTDKKPFQFAITRKLPDGKFLFDTNLTVSLESYTIKEQADNGFDLIASIKLKQFRKFGTKTVKIVSQKKVSVQPKREQVNSPAPPKEETYTVKSGDCLWNIAKKLYGNGAKYTKIYEANKDKIKNPNLIYAGQVLTIPAA